MKIRSGVTPTPIVSTATIQTNALSSQSTPATTLHAPRVETGPLTIDLGDKKIELHSGELAKVVEKLNQAARVFNQSLQFQMGDGNHIVIRVIDTISGQIVREIPPEKAMDAVARMEDVLGLLLDVKA